MRIRRSELGKTGRFPDFVGVGAEKCATTWLFDCLQAHPDICTPRLKELEFFDRNFDKGYRWYARQFRRCDPKKITGEISPRYIYSEYVVERLAELRPVKVIVSLRDPVDRAYSEYWMDVRGMKARGERVPTFREAIGRNAKYIAKGKYHRYLDRYIETFSQDELSIVLVDDIEEAPREVLSCLYRFLGVEDCFVPDDIRERSNPAKAYRSAWLFGVGQRLVRKLEALGLEEMVHLAKKLGVRDVVLGILEKQEAYPELPPELRREVATQFRVANARLEEVLGRELNWS